MSKIRISPYLLVLLSFVLLIFFGTFLLTLPISHSDGQWASFLDSLFLSTSAVCVTGLSVYADVAAELSTFGEISLLALVAMGGLGLITVFTFLVTLSGRRIGIIERFIVKEALGLTSMEGAIRFVRKVMFISLTIEAIGIIPLMFVFVPRLGFGPGLYNSIFIAVSAFNNAGFDLLGSTSLIAYSGDFIVNFTVMGLIISGGLGFPVWIDLLSGKSVKNWSAYSKIVILMTSILIVGGAGLLLLVELGQPSNMSILQAFFQSVTSRTAGFATIDINSMSLAGRLVIMVLMFIGAGPISTGGGIKTTTTFIIILAIFSFIKGSKVHAFRRSFSTSTVIRALTLTFIALVVVFTSMVLVDRFESSNPAYPVGLFDSTAFFFESFSAFGTVGLSQGVTPYLTSGSKIILSMLMLFGRIGPMTMISVFSESMNQAATLHFEYVEAVLPIG